MVLHPKHSPPTRNLRSNATFPQPEKKLLRLHTGSSNKRHSDLSDTDDQSPTKKQRIGSPSPRRQRIPLRRREHDKPPPQADIPQPITGLLPKSRRHLPPVNTSIAGSTTLIEEHKISINNASEDRDGGNHNDKRSLRSHDGGSRTRSELAMYFHNYDQMISLEPQKPEFLTPSTQITLIDDLSIGAELAQQLKSPQSSRNAVHRVHDSPRRSTDSTVYKGWKHLHNVRRIDLIEADPASRRSTKDPLPSDLFMVAHRRPERQEKQLRNIEKERAQHEKVQLERLLAELKGPDWLRVMGISGITETEKKLYEPKRAMFTKEVSAMIEKFKLWKEEEKRRKLEREQAILAEQEEDDSEVAEEDNDEVPSPIRDQEEGKEIPDSNVLDAWAARQLHQEAKSASTRKKATKSAQNAPAPLPPPPPLSPIKSFYSKKHLRDAALGNHRRGGRMITAFGLPLPDMDQRDFELPPELLSKDSIRAIARNRRRLRRDRAESEQQ